MLMVISSSSLGTLVLVLDIPRAYGGVEHSFGGFFEWEDSEGLDLLLLPTA